MSSDRYPQLYLVCRAYFGQDFDLFGDTIAEIVSCYMQDSPPQHHQDLIREINLFFTDHPDTIELEFKREYGTGFKPKLWGHTSTSFLNELKRLLSE
ncbi:hypothetical protein LJ656_01275 [Paraburkholderia sp. MMS20-SJTR3]|uniref:CdiI immunity protein domain-containing protein n=1 Tax=Paraburkholderia sejongensis TaxID=2886946 RepID=A0ABS8JMS1_9BURK|nr:contact-dependent growth inhibition system immunity protein [Paraburkholderia sp. MMS20-SJTR3]MCC8391205.1 hypothetical protein [Paraburkholderia sp. MMS20-SJTR3]